MDIPDETGDLDLVLRHVSRLFPEQFARALVPPGADVTINGWLDTQVTGRQRRLDRALDAIVNGERRLLHGEWQLRMSSAVPFRVYEYNSLMVLALADELAVPPISPLFPASLHDPVDPNHPRLPPIESTLVLLSGREEPWPERGEFRTSPLDAPFSGVSFRIEPVYQRTVAELSAKGSLLWMIFAPLAVDATGERMGEVVRDLRAQTSKREFEELAVALAAVADADQRERCLREPIVAFLPKEVVVQSWIFKQGKAEGKVEGEAKGRAEGEAKGKAEGKAESVLRVLKARGVRVSKAIRERVLRAEDPATLDRLLERAVTVKKAADIFDDSAN